MLDVWRAADEIELFESAWNFDHFYPIFAGDPPDRASRAGRCSPPWPRPHPDPARLPGDRHDLPAPGGAGQHGRDRRHHLRRAARARPRRRLERGGVRRLRHPAAAPERALRPLRRGPGGDRRPADQRDHHAARPLRPAHRGPLRAEAGAAPAPAHHASAAAARSARCAPSPGWAQHVEPHRARPTGRGHAVLHGGAPRSAATRPRSTAPRTSATPPGTIWRACRPGRSVWRGGRRPRCRRHRRAARRQARRADRERAGSLAA